MIVYAEIYTQNYVYLFLCLKTICVRLSECSVLLLCSDGELNGSTDISTLQVEVGVKVLLWSNSSGVCGSGKLHSHVL